MSTGFELFPRGNKDEDNSIQGNTNWGLNFSESSQIFDHDEEEEDEVEGKESKVDQSVSMFEHHQWDAFREISDDTESYWDEGCITWSKRILKVVFIFVLAILVLGCLISSKISMLFITSSMNPYFKFRETDSEAKSHNNTKYSTCGVPTCMTSQERPNNNVRWIWSLHMAMCVPYVFCCLKSLWKVAFKTKQSPKRSTVLWVLLVESLHSMGLFMLVFLGLPKLDAFRGILTLCAIGFVPSFLRAFSLTQENRRNRVFDALSAFVQIGGLIAWFVKVIIDPLLYGGNKFGELATLTQEDVCQQVNLSFTEEYCLDTAQYLKNKQEFSLTTPWDNITTDTIEYTTEAATTAIATTTAQALDICKYFLVEYLPEHAIDYWPIPCGVLLISVVWWENFIDKDFNVKPDWAKSMLERLVTRLNGHKRNIQKTHVKLNVIVSLWKLAFSTALLLAFFSPTVFPWGVGFNALFDEKNFHADDDGDEFMDYDWLILFAAQAAPGLLCKYFFSMAVRASIQIPVITIPIVLCTPLSLAVAIWACYDCSNTWQLNAEDRLFWNCFSGHGDITDILISRWGIMGITFWFAELWTTRYLWYPKVERLAKTERIFIHPFYCSLTLEQSLAFNRRRNDEEFELVARRILPDYSANQDRTPDDMNLDETTIEIKAPERTTPMIYCCATMWHENEAEMIQILKSFFWLDKDQHARRMAKEAFKLKDKVKDYYEFEMHILFDDAFEAHLEDATDYEVNSFVKQFCRVIQKAALEVHGVRLLNLSKPERIETPYGGQLKYTFPGSNKMIVHLKDKLKIRHKKRWSQVMYMYYLLGEKLWARKDVNSKFKQVQADNTYILALDGDVDFRPDAVRLLLDLMKRDLAVAATCGRIHPIGSGPMVWYQKFEYALGHWLSKSTEHVLGCVLCSPGCFSMFRASALMDDNVMKTYTKQPSEAVHYVQYDQGEDRWLCTLLLQAGFKVEYSAAADALTYCPEGFAEFFNQRRRWTPSTFANILDLLKSAGPTVKKNQNISTLYMVYQVALFVSSILGPATIFLLIVNSLNIALNIGKVWSLFMVLIPMAIFIFLCLVTKTETQIMAAAVLATLMAVVQIVVLVGIMRQVAGEGLCHPNTMLLLFMMGTFVFAALLHPQEFTNLFHGFIFYLAIPTMYLLLIVYSICNLNVVSWGTREVPKTNIEKENERKILEKNQQSKQSKILSMLPAELGIKDTKDGIPINCGSLCRCLCCLKDGRTDDAIQIERLTEKMTDMNRAIEVLTGAHRAENAIEMALPHLSEDEAEDGEDAPLLAMSADMPLVVPSIIEEESGDSEEDEDEDKDEDKEEEDEDETGSLKWISDKDLGRGERGELEYDEEAFWKELIAKYLFPLVSDKVEQEKAAMQLKELRNQSIFAFVLIDVLLIALMETVSMSIGTDESLAITWNCTDPISHTTKVVELDPVAIMFIIVFGIIVGIQFTCMFGHRLMTWLQIVSNTSIRPPKKSGDPRAQLDQMDAEQVVELAFLMADLRHAQDGTPTSSRAPSLRGSAAEELPLAKKLNSRKYRKKTAMSMDKAFKQRFAHFSRENAAGSVRGSSSAHGSRTHRDSSNHEMELANRFHHLFDIVEEQEIPRDYDQNSVQTESVPVDYA